MVKRILKKGSYYIGDPCYVFDKSWSEILDETDYFSDDEAMDKLQIWANNTAYGDGTYEDNEGNEYDVDAGLIGIMPIKNLRIDNVVTWRELKEKKGMHYFKFDSDVEIDFTEKGIFEFKSIHTKIIIDTKNDEEEEYW